MVKFALFGVGVAFEFMGFLWATARDRMDGALSVELFREEYWRLDLLTVAREAKAKTLAV
jgi:hypothetical protein